MSNSPTFHSTITGGIQDISSLLPLLGTEQCEKHVGSALDAGFLYSSVTPISIFGSLGIVRASFNILVATLNVPRYEFIGAKLLHHSGFSPSGTVAPMIALDPKHPHRFLAETKLEAMVAEEHIDNVPGLTVSWLEGTVQWNMMLVASTLLISSAGLLPYISLILDSGDARPKPFFPLGFGFPILRVFGSAICVIVAQFLIQLRILILMKTRLLFTSIDRLAKLENVPDLSSQINAGLKRGKADNVWTSELAAERNIWALQKWLSTMPNTEGGSNYQRIEALYTSEYAQHFGSINILLHSWVPVFLCFSLAIGCISTVIGYIGCFFLVQHSTTSKGPLLWLVLEAVLSILRIFVWAINPSWDDSKGAEFELQLCSSSSLLTGNKSLEQILQNQAIVWVPESDSTLRDIVAFAGPCPTFTAQGIEISYIVAINSQSNPSKHLLIVVSTEMKQKSILLFKNAAGQPFSIYQCTLQTMQATGLLLALRVFEPAPPNYHAITADSVFMAELEAHYNTINYRLQNRANAEEKKMAIFGKTWGMAQPAWIAHDSRQPHKADIGPLLLTDGDKARLNYYAMQGNWHTLHASLHTWVDKNLAAYNDGLNQTSSSPNQDAIKTEWGLFLQQQEAAEKGHLLIECQLLLDQFLVCIYAKWATHLFSSHAAMVEINLKSMSEKSVTSPPDVSSKSEQRRNSIYGRRLEDRLFVEQGYFLKQDIDSKLVVVTNRYKKVCQLLMQQWGIQWDTDMHIRRRMGSLIESLSGFYFHKPIHHLSPSRSLSTPHSRYDLAGAFKLPSNLATTFNSMSVSEQYGMLLQIQKEKFVEEMEQRFAGYPLNSNGEAKDMMDLIRDRSRMRAHRLFDVLTFTETTGLKRIMDLPGPGLPSDTELVNVLKEADRRWAEKVRQSENELAKMDEHSKGKRVEKAEIAP